MVVLHAYVPIKPEARERWLSIVDVVARASRAEEAYRGYRIYEDIEAPSSFIFVEEWESLDGLYRYYQTPHFTAFFAALPEVLAGPPGGSVHEVASTLRLNESLAAGGVSA